MHWVVLYVIWDEVIIRSCQESHLRDREHVHKLLHFGTLEQIIIKYMSHMYSQVHKYWDIDTILTFLALYTTTMDFKWNEQDVL